MNDITTNRVKIFTITSEYSEQLYTDMFEKIKEMDNF